jgi:midasin
MDNAEYRGDFKTGKKLNLKKIIPFIASNFRKDRIWLRRTEPSERNYYVMLALDDTKSMHYGAVGTEALKGLLAISLALEHLAVKTSICAIRDRMQTLKGFGDLLNSQAVLGNFGFSYESSNSHDLSMAAFMEGSLEAFGRVESEDLNVEVRKLCFIISDGKMNKKLVGPFMKEARK